MELTYEELFRFGTGMAIYFVITIPIYIIFIVGSCCNLIKMIREFRVKRINKK